MRLNYFRCGEQNDTNGSVVLLHGLFGGSGYFRSLADQLGKAWDIIAVDLPGFAGSAEVPVPGDMRGYAAAIVDLLDFLDLRAVHWLGYSLGGAIAQQATLDFPDRARSLICYATKPALLDEDRFESFEATLARLANADIDRTVRSQAVNWFDAGANAPAFEACLAAAKGVTARSAAGCLTAIKGWDVRHRLGELHMPALIISGDRDRSISLETLVAHMRALPHAELCILPKAGHICHLEHPDLFVGAVSEFIARVQRAA